MPDKVLITGASGFIGSAVCRRLIGNRPVAIVSPFSKPWRLEAMEERLDVVRLDLTDTNEVERLVASVKPTCIVHLATHGVYPYQQEDQQRIAVANYSMTFNLLSSATRHGVRRFVNAGSVFEYGARRGIVSEADVSLSEVLSIYAASKMATTALAKAFSDKLSVITVRPFTVYGPYEDATRFVMATIARATDNAPVRIAGGVTRDFGFIEDVVAGVLMAASTEAHSGEVVNLGTGRAISLEVAAGLIIELTHSSSAIVVDESYRRAKESQCWADLRAVKSILNWEPKWSLRSALEETIRWYRGSVPQTTACVP